MKKCVPKKMVSKAQLRFYKLVKVLHKIGIFLGVLTFTFDGKRSVVRRSRVLEVYNCFMTILITVALLINYVEICMTIAKATHLDENARIILIVLDIIQPFTIIAVLLTLLICLVTNRQAIVDLVNDGLKTEREFRRSYKVKAWNPVKILIIINSKDIITTIGLMYYSSSLKIENTPISHYYVVPYSMMFRFFFSFVENLKIFSIFYLAHLLRTLNDRFKILKRIDRQSDFEVQQAFEGISKMYGRLVILAEEICRVLKYHTTAILMYSLTVTTTKVLNN
jgi:hypothetical protein